MSDQSFEFTERGFRIYLRTNDLYGTAIRVQESSLATEECVWIFTGTNEHHSSLHLNYEQAETLISALSEWMEDVEERETNDDA